MKKKPFFAKFLENQNVNMEEVKGGAIDQTMKAPSDNDEDMPCSFVDDYPKVTLKYPSDNDEGGTDLM